MRASKPSAESDLFVCYPLSDMDDLDEADVKAFVPVDERGSGVVSYLQGEALSDELAGLMRTYLVRDAVTGELAAFFSLKAGIVSFNERCEGKAPGFDTLPGVELANFAMEGGYRARHPETRGYGGVVFYDLVLPVIREAARHVGVAAVYLFSLPEESVIENYRRYGFERLGEAQEALLHARLKPRYDRSCVFMYAML